MFQKPGLFPFSGKEAPNLVDRLEPLSVTEHHRNNDLLRYAPENSVVQ